MDETVRIWKVEFLDRTDGMTVVRTAHFLDEATAYAAAGRWTVYGQINAVVTAIDVDATMPPRASRSETVDAPDDDRIYEEWRE
jgi:hypothetical protein